MIRSDIVRVYREVHSWAGIIAGLFLFVAFYAGSVSMFEQTLQNWLTPVSTLPKAVSIEQTPELLDKIFAAHPEARKAYTIVLNPNRQKPGRVMWAEKANNRGHEPSAMNSAALTADGSLITITTPPSGTAFFIDTLHRKVGLPLTKTAASLIMGTIALAYALALVSGVIAYLPALKRTLFAVRLEGAEQRAWLDVHNLFGLFSLPFHLVMALTSVVFAFHEPIYAIEQRLFASPATNHEMPGHERSITSFTPPPANGFPLIPTKIIASLAQEAPGFIPDTIEYAEHARGGRGGPVLRVTGHDNRFIMRGPAGGFATLDPMTGHILSAEYLPGHQSRGMAVLTAFFALHFGSYGGAIVRWGYLILGFGGAFLFYTGNRLWIRSRQRKGADTRGTLFLARLTSGCCAGCIAGITLLIVIAASQTGTISSSDSSLIYYMIFILFIAASFTFPLEKSNFIFLIFLACSNGALAAIALKRALHEGDLSSTGILLVALIQTICFGVFAKRQMNKSFRQLATTHLST
ncbi:MAG: PepSY domain-containing protein [Acetobacter sp.]|jgi:uncharacterized iron-regulated membrane protein|nr:PepSY domain-containing protein [Acetobacter sp.]MCH4060929.1 PepSY domain-containing protein [Acetobacter sp.]MCH4087869.1 PepSY domain-containing protein [Acetobacter sp.]MCI1293515.1 PepSY domain-containing protein [Acetobacter sp.]MCI1319799.1 PepSY domain-containing protein [Acetobacter sp.]